MNTFAGLAFARYWLRKILFTYRVWGSTRMGDRAVEVDATPLGELKPEAIQRLTEIVLGLYYMPGRFLSVQQFAFDP